MFWHKAEKFDTCTACGVCDKYQVWSNGVEKSEDFTQKRANRYISEMALPIEDKEDEEEEIFLKIWNFSENLKIFWKSEFFPKIWHFSKNLNLSKNLTFFQKSKFF